MKTLKFHGSLAALCPDGFTVEASSVVEAISALQHHPSFNPSLGKQYAVVVEGFGTRDGLFAITDVEVINIHPAMAGSGGRGVAQILVGAVLIAASFFVPGGQFVAMAFMSSGIAMVAGGVLQMLMPQPTVTGQSDEKSRYLSGAKNTVAIGTRIPLIYGTRKAYGHYISFNIDATDMGAIPKSWYVSHDNYSDTQTGSAPA